jgi:putative peptidoglycan lipid II flippase
MTTNSVIQLVTLFLPISILTIINAKDIVDIVFGRGKFDNDAVQNCSIALIGYSCMFVPFIIRELYSRFQYGYEDSTRPMINSTLAIIVNIVLSIVLSQFIGVIGVTIATSISVAICGGLNYSSSRKINKNIKIKGMMNASLRWLVGIMICIIVSLLGRSILIGGNMVLRFVIISSVSLLLYFIVTFPIIKPLICRMIRK